MPETDYGIAAKVAAPQFDPLATVGKLMQVQQGQQAVQQGILNNRLLGQNIAGREAQGRAVTGAIRPDGSIDYDAAVTALGKDPQGAWSAPEFAQKAQEQRLAQLTAARAQLGLSDEQGKFLAKGFAPFVYKFTQPDPKTGIVPVPTIDDFKGMLVDTLVAMGPAADGNVSSRAAALLQDMQTRKPEEIVQRATGLMQIGDPEGALKAANGGLTVSEATAPTDAMIQRPDGTMAKGSIMRKDFIKEAAKGGVMTGAPMTAEGVPLSEAGTPAYNVQDPTTGQPGIVTKGAAAAAARGAVPPPVVATGPQLGTADTIADNVKQAQTLQQRAAEVPVRRAALKNMSDTIDTFTSGPLAARVGALKGLATQFGLKNFKVDESRAGQEEFNKLAGAIALQQLGQTGTGSNEQLGANIKANPNDAMSRMGNKNVMALLRGNDDALEAMDSSWKAYRTAHGPGSYGDFLNDWRKIFDPRVFQAQHMNPGAVKLMLSKMTPDERKQFQWHKSIAEQAHWIAGE